MQEFILYNPTRIIFGKGKTDQLPEVMKLYGKNVLLVYGGGSIHQNGLYTKIQKLLKGYRITELSGVQPNPRLASVYEGIRLCREQHVDFILAVGGGSCIDCAKAIGIGACYNGDVWDFFSGRARVQESLPVGIILTIAATGSEMNCFSVITNEATKEKTGTGGYDCMYPKFSILDPQNTIHLPMKQTAYGCVDIISHACEAYFSGPEKTPIQDGIAETIMKTVVENSEILLTDPENYAARENIMWCATLALHQVNFCGKQSDWGSHHIEELLSGHYDIAHGAGLSIIMPEYMRFMNRFNSRKYKQFAVRVWDVETEGKTDQEIGQEGIERMAAYFKRLGAPLTLTEGGLEAVDCQLIAKLAFESGPIGNYREMTQCEIEELLCSVY